MKETVNQTYKTDLQKRHVIENITEKLISCSQLSKDS